METNDATPEKEEKKEEVLVPVVKEIRDEHSNRYRKTIVWEKPKPAEEKK